MDKPEILIGHNLSKGEGWAFVCNDQGCARVFKSMLEAQDHIEIYLDKRIWQVVQLMNIPKNY